MIFSSMEYPGKDYRVQVVDTWLGEEFEPMDNPKNGDKIVYRIIGENGQPVEQKTEIYQNGAWVEQGGGGGGDEFSTAKVTVVNNHTVAVTLAAPILAQDGEGHSYAVTSRVVSPGATDELQIILADSGAAMIVNVFGAIEVNVDGDITIQDPNQHVLIVTGDGTVTITSGT